jgi:hypothetical protein
MSLPGRRSQIQIDPSHPTTVCSTMHLCVKSNDQPENPGGSANALDVEERNLTSAPPPPPVQAKPSDCACEHGYKKLVIQFLAVASGAFLGHVCTFSYVTSKNTAPCVHTYRPLVIPDGKIDWESICESRIPTIPTATTTTATVTATETITITFLHHAAV